MVSAWLSEKRLNSFPKGHKGLVSLIIRKVMARPRSPFRGPSIACSEDWRSGSVAGSPRMT
jgi:hypothetical protein